MRESRYHSTNKLDSSISETPPLLYSPATIDRTPSPLSTPKLSNAYISRPLKGGGGIKERAHLYPYSWHNDHQTDFPLDFGTSSTLLDSDLEFGEQGSQQPFPLFEQFGSAMDGEPSRFVGNKEDSLSPRQSNLTAQFQTDYDRSYEPIAMDISNPSQRYRQNSVSMSGLTPTQYSGVAMPISTGKSIPRRESLAGSMMHGLSFGGISMGSWVHDEYVHFFYIISWSIKLMFFCFLA